MSKTPGDANDAPTASAPRQQGFRLTATQATVIVSVVSLLAGALGATISGYFDREGRDIEAQSVRDVEATRAQSQIALEQLKFESSLILKAIEQPDLDERIKALRFFANAGLIPRHKDDILALTEEGNARAIPSLAQGPRVCRFEKNALTYALADTVPSALAPVLQRALANVYAQWSEASGLAIVPVPRADNADIVVAMTDRPNIVGYAQFPCDGGQAKIFLGQDQNWVSLGRGTTTEAAFLFTALLHEAGHTLGLHHDDSGEAIMSLPTPKLDRLTERDIASVRSLYGRPAIQR
ncbi:MAG: matrixin family metalloprotease [Pseudomonadota bacterium]